LPALPAIAVLVGLQIDQMMKDRTAMTRVEILISGVCGFVIGAVLLACAVLGLSWRGQPAPAPYAARLLSGTIGWQAGQLSDARIWYRLSPFTMLAPGVLAIASLTLVATMLILSWRREVGKVTAVGAVLCLMFAFMFSQVTMPAWSRFDIEP